MKKNVKSTDASDPIKPIKEKKVKVKAKDVPSADTRIHYDVFSKSRGYICTCPDENSVYDTLKALLRENDRFWKQAASMGKKTKAFDCYGVMRQGFKTSKIELTFAPETDGSERDTYEDVVEEAQNVQ